jgi:hypothetical protein
VIVGTCSLDCVAAFNMGKSEIEFDKLSDSNYGTWASRMEMLLVLKGYYGVVECELTAEACSEEEALDNKARALIGSHVSDQYLPTYSSSNFAFELWNTLKETFVQKNTVRRLSLRRELNSL